MLSIIQFLVILEHVFHILFNIYFIESKYDIRTFLIVFIPFSEKNIFFILHEQ